MSRNFYWSDLHLGHDKVAQLRGFDSTAAHDAHIFDRWEAAVTKRDTVWVLGDLAMASPRLALALIETLPGTKHLILGNHDAAHPMHRNAHRQQKRYLQAFDSVQTMARHKLAGKDFLLSHHPYRGDSGAHEDRHTQYRLRDEGMPLIHGHVHEEWLVNGYQVNVGVDRWMDGPATTEEILEVLR